MLLVLAIYSLVPTLLVSVVIARSIARPITALTDYARQLQENNYAQGPPAIRGDELGLLATTLTTLGLTITARERQIEAMAYHDALTGLPNRTLFNDRLHQALEVARRLHQPMGVMPIDLNRFKEMNDISVHLST